MSWRRFSLPTGFFSSFLSHSSMLPVVSSILVSMMASHDAIPDLVARLSKLLFDRCNGNCELVTEIVKEISKLDFSESKSSTDVRNLSHFIVIPAGSLLSRPSVRSKPPSRFFAHFPRCRNSSRGKVTRCDWRCCRVSATFSSKRPFRRLRNLPRKIPRRIPRSPIMRQWRKIAPVFWCVVSRWWKRAKKRGKKRKKKSPRRESISRPRLPSSRCFENVRKISTRSSERRRYVR